MNHLCTHPALTAVVHPSHLRHFAKAMAVAVGFARASIVVAAVRVVEEPADSIPVPAVGMTAGVVVEVVDPIPVVVLAPAELVGSILVVAEAVVEAVTALTGPIPVAGTVTADSISIAQSGKTVRMVGSIAVSPSHFA